MSNFRMGDWAYCLFDKKPKKDLLKDIDNFLKELVIQKERMYWNRKRLRLLSKLERDYENLKKFVKTNKEVKE